MTVLEMAAALALFGGVVVTLFTIAEKVTGFGQRWLARGVQEGTHPLREDVHSMKADLHELRDDLADHRLYTRHHLGPNGESPRLHDRVEAIEQAVLGVSNEQERVRHDLEARQAPHVDWHAPYDDEDGA